MTELGQPNGKRRLGVQFEGKITLGAIIQLVFIIGGGVYTLATIQANLSTVIREFAEFKGEVTVRFDRLDNSVASKMDKLPIGTAITPAKPPG